MGIIKTERDWGMAGIPYQRIPLLSFTFCSSCQTDRRSDEASATRESIRRHLVFPITKKGSVLDCLRQSLRRLSDVQHVFTV